MQRQRATFIVLLASLVTAAGLLYLPQPRHTKVDVIDLSTGRNMLSAVLREGDQVVLTWTNSIFRLPVTEVFVAEGGALVLQQVTFEDPRGVPPTRVTASEVEDLYHTGGAFASQEMHRPFTHVVFRVGEVGSPKLAVKGRVVDFKQEVGFGGRVALTVRQARCYDSLLDLGRLLLNFVPCEGRPSPHGTEPCPGSLFHPGM
ncbi:MAG: DUF1850 domain-containing protein [Anaerolineae bacterium]